MCGLDFNYVGCDFYDFGLGGIDSGSDFCDFELDMCDLGSDFCVVLIGL